jgi:hypothetical protein
MAEGHRMTAADLVDKLLADEHADVLRQRGLAGHPADGGRSGCTDRRQPG